ncbi:DUF3530 family protein [Methylomonas sp. MgM2]
MILRILLLCGFLIHSLGADASDRLRELEYANELQRGGLIGNVVRLSAEGQSFLGLMTDAERTDNKNAVLVLHDMGGHPDQKPLVHGLRTILAEHDWMTLAIQLPLRETGAHAVDYYGLFDEAKMRIESAVEYLRNNGAKNIAIVGVGVGAAMAAYTLSLDPNALFALVTISLPVPDLNLPQANIGDFIKNIALPFLDIYAEFDLPEVAGSAHLRKMSAKDNPVYRQIKINGENHAYRFNPNLVIKRVNSWLALNLSPN